MKYWIVFALLFHWSVSEAAGTEMQIRFAFHRIASENDLNVFISNCESSDWNKADLYKSVATMRKAEYVLSPLKKFEYFKLGKEAIEAFLKANPEDVEVRYLRLMVQNNLPKFLGYSSQMEEDRLFVTRNLESSNLPLDFQSLIRQNMKTIKA
ncbi:hypothetical protein LAG90_19025 [Marinilongibacter aquaticus]|uniref:hypothetical protein n=1 Tax=Marinilongibacter aquaticus TaxID=2975157 RepID=UPI0021BD154C|nr:hypothetical protein [Marinilongibacter aquaticus]UBM58894.1 hypothetical protein LAG90_19025 [Marinilongibacter aquaticus]